MATQSAARALWCYRPRQPSLVMAGWRCSVGCRWGCDDAEAVGVIGGRGGVDFCCVSSVAVLGGVGGGFQEGYIETREFTP